MVEQGLKSRLPERIGRLDELAYSLWWSWHPQARDLFRAIDYMSWRMSGHNPIRQLREVSSGRLHAAATDLAFLTLYDSVMSAFDEDMATEGSWFAMRYPQRLSGPIAYFSAEFAIHNSLPIYAGGLGVLAGDLCKEASDLGLPLVAVGFMYPHGYFNQCISADGRQKEIYRPLNFEEAPIKPISAPDGGEVLTLVEVGGRSIAVGVWHVAVGHADLYLLDTDVEENSHHDRQLAARLYTADRELRIQQEIILGIGGVRVLRALDIQPAVWHANEGHAAFMMLERIREQVEGGASLDEAIQQVQHATAFTTHTPLPAGQDLFATHLVKKYLQGHLDSLGVDLDTFMKLGRQDGTDETAFNMTAFGLRMAAHRNAVSALHQNVAQKMWHGLWPELAEEDVPITHVTNGIHIPTWIAPELCQLFDEYLGQGWIERCDDMELWQRVWDIPDYDFWEVRQLLKNKLLAAMRERSQRRCIEDGLDPRQLLPMGALLHPEVLTIGFVRRFAAYKRPELILRDAERLKRIITDQRSPVQIVFAGKSHPADLPSKNLLQQVYTMAADQGFQGRIAFVEDYDMHIAHYLTQGVDIWLNNPRRLHEASGTSGMKAALNGVPQLSVRDGWWYEGYNGTNGWVIGDDAKAASEEEEDSADAESLYRLLEEEVVPLYYDRDRKGVPLGWIAVAKEAMRSVAPLFNTRRMLKEYIERMYMPEDQV